MNKYYYKDGSMIVNKYYYKDGSILDYYDKSKVLHRIDGPAIEYADGSKFWYIDGKRHKIDGPAAEYSNGSKYWYIDGINLSEENFNKHPKVLKYKYEQQFYKELEEGL